MKGGAQRSEERGERKRRKIFGAAWGVRLELWRPPCTMSVRIGMSSREGGTTAEGRRGMVVGECTGQSSGSPRVLLGLASGTHSHTQP